MEPVWKTHQRSNVANTLLHWFTLILVKDGWFVVLQKHDTHVFNSCPKTRQASSTHRPSVVRCISEQPHFVFSLTHLFPHTHIAAPTHLHSISGKLLVATACIRGSKVQEQLNVCSTSVFKHVSATRESFNLLDTTRSVFVTVNEAYVQPCRC